jgi:hypothetical protein
MRRPWKLYRSSRYNRCQDAESMNCVRFHHLIPGATEQNKLKLGI